MDDIQNNIVIYQSGEMELKVSGEKNKTKYTLHNKQDYERSVRSSI